MIYRDQNPKSDYYQILVKTYGKTEANRIWAQRKNKSEFNLREFYDKVTDYLNRSKK